MDVERYIASGKLEAYVLGELSEAEEQEVLRMAREHSEIKDELRALERTQEQLAFEGAITPPDSVRDALLSQINFAATTASPTTSPTPSSTASPTASPEGATVAAAEDPPPPERPVEKSASSRQLPRWVPVGMAAAIGWIVLATGAAFYFWQQWQGAEENLQLALAQNQQIAQQYEQVRQASDTLEQQLGVLSDPNAQQVSLLGQNIAPDARAVVYWNPDSERVYLNPAGLPSLSTDQQYQLWAIVDGAPVSAGVIPLSASGFLQMEQIANASAFAITLEPLGGSESPTLEAMYVMGEV